MRDFREVGVDVENTVNKLRLLDLFCGAGGCAKGYQRAGFYVVGVDIKPQPHYCGDEFYQGDALEYLAAHVTEFDAIHASPPCQAHCALSCNLGHVDLIPATREALRDAPVWVIENVERAPLVNPIRLCGSSFGLLVQRHRLFESSVPLVSKPCDHSWWSPRFFQNDYSRKGHLANVVAVYGSSRFKGDYELRCAAMGISWMDIEELAQAIPPAYTEWIGKQLIRVLEQQHQPSADEQSDFS